MECFENVTEIFILFSSPLVHPNLTFVARVSFSCQFPQSSSNILIAGEPAEESGSWDSAPSSLGLHIVPW